jgi:hypothetical protein
LWSEEVEFDREKSVKADIPMAERKKRRIAKRADKIHFTSDRLKSGGAE